MNITAFTALFLRHGPVDIIKLPCGNTAHFFGFCRYRCNHCDVILGDELPPNSCLKIYEKYQTLSLLGGPNWQYVEEKDETS